MNMYIFHHDLFKYYYNCSMHTTEEWNEFGVKRTFFAAFCVVLGITVLVMYIPCLLTMLKPQLWNLSCYKLMFLNGIIDMWGVFTSCFLTGFLGYKGAVYCSYPDFLYIYGSSIIGVWGAQCMTVLLLAFNRCIDFWQIGWLTDLFEGRKMYFWYCAVVVYSIFMHLYAAAAPYNSPSNMWVLDPYFMIPGIEADTKPYENVVLLNINNMILLSGLSTCYVVLICSIWYKGRYSAGAAMSRFQRQVTIQAALICSFIYTSTIIYLCFEFFPTLLPSFFMTISFIGWQFGFCGVIFIYMTMNKALKTGVINFYLDLLGMKKADNRVTSSQISKGQITNPTNTSPYSVTNA